MNFLMAIAILIQCLQSAQQTISVRSRLVMGGNHGYLSLLGGNQRNTTVRANQRPAPSWPPPKLPRALTPVPAMPIRQRARAPPRFDRVLTLVPANSAYKQAPVLNRYRLGYIPALNIPASSTTRLPPGER